MPEPVLANVLRGPAHPALLSLMAQIHKGNEAHCESIALNPATDDATIAWLATLPHTRVVDIISQNQERMMRHEEIVDALGANPLTGRVGDRADPLLSRPRGPRGGERTRTSSARRRPRPPCSRCSARTWARSRSCSPPRAARSTTRPSRAASSPRCRRCRSCRRSSWPAWAGKRHVPCSSRIAIASSRPRSSRARSSRRPRSSPSPRAARSATSSCA